MLRNCLRFGAAALACFSSVVSAQQNPAATPTTSVTTEGAPAQRASLAQCIKLALARNIDVRNAGEDTELARAQESGVKGQFGPRLNLDATYQRWTEPYVFPDRKSVV